MVNLEILLHVLSVVVLSYLLGSIPTAYLIAKLKQIDIFAVGSGNMGATNVTRALGLHWGLAVWFLDSAKGVIAILMSWRILPENLALATTLAALVSIIGHNWSLFASLITGKLRGGKGAATAFGTLLIIAPLQIVVVCFALSGAIIVLTRLMSLGVLVMFAVSLSWLTILVLQSKMPPEFILYTFNVAALIFLRFRENIDRLLKGTERRLGDPA